MKKDMKETGLPEPVFETEGMFTVIFYRPSANISKEKTIISALDSEQRIRKFS